MRKIEKQLRKFLTEHNVLKQFESNTAAFENTFTGKTIAENLDQCYEKYRTYHNIITGSFGWAGTNEGNNFWNNIHEKWWEYCDDKLDSYVDDKKVFEL